MRHTKILLVIILLIATANSAKAQFDGIYSQYMHMKPYYNSATIGEQEMMRVLIAQRLQWIGIKNAPKTTPKVNATMPNCSLNKTPTAMIATL